MYFVKVVSTSYLPLGWQAKPGVLQAQDELVNEMLPMGSHGRGEDGSLETHQYSVTSHKRSLNGGSDSAEGHKERLHARGGIPGVFFSYVSASLLFFPFCDFVNRWLCVSQGPRAY